MKKITLAILLLTFISGIITPSLSLAARKSEIDRDVKTGLQTLYDSNEMAKILSEKAKGILIFPSIIKGGLFFGAQYGDGALLKGSETLGYYNSVEASYGLQAGIQKFGYAMFFMTDDALSYLNKSDGWEVGVGPNIVIVDKETAAAFGKNLSSSTLKDNIYAFVFSQKGLMAGIALQGSKITKILPE